MAILDPLHPIQSSILEALGSSRGLSTAELHSILIKQYKLNISIKNLYRTVSQMVVQQILLRTEGKLYLNLVWLAQLTQFAEKASALYLSKSANTKLPTTKESKKYFTEYSLEDLDPIWNDILMELLSATKERQWYAYNSHPWYSLGMRETETRLFQGLTTHGVKVRMAYGNDSFLDRYGLSLVKVRGFKAKVAEQLPFPKEGYALWCVGDYLVECIFPDSISNHLAFFFRSVESVKEFNLDLFADIFRMRSRVVLSIVRDPNRSRSKRNILEKSFLQ